MSHEKKPDLRTRFSLALRNGINHGLRMAANAPEPFRPFIREGLITLYHPIQGGLTYGSDDMPPQGMKRPEAYDLEGFRAKHIHSFANDRARIGLWEKAPESNDKPIYVIFHGRNGSWVRAGNNASFSGLTYDKEFRLNWLKEVAEQGAGVIAVHRRGTGLSSRKCKITEQLVVKDMQAVAHYLAKQHIDPSRVIILGESLGGAFATILAEEMTKKKMPPAMLAMMNTFSSMEHMSFRNITGDKAVDSYLPSHVHENLFAKITRKRVNGLIKNKFFTDKRLTRLLPDTWVYIANTEGDRTVPAAESDRLEDFARQAGLHVERRQFLAHELPKLHTRAHCNWDIRVFMDEIREYYHDRQHATQAAPSELPDSLMNGTLAANGVDRNGHART